MFSKILTGRVKNDGTREDVQEKEFVFHIYGHTEGVTGVLISNEVYPTRNAHVLLGKIVDEFLQQNGNAKTASGPVAFPALKDYILKYQKADDVDQIAKITRELEDTKIVLHKTIESVLERGEKLDDLVQKSEGLSSQSKMFYTSAKKQNSCCIIM